MTFGYYLLTFVCKRLKTTIGLYLKQNVLFFRQTIFKQIQVNLCLSLSEGCLGELSICRMPLLEEVKIRLFHLPEFSPCLFSTHSHPVFLFFHAINEDFLRLIGWKTRSLRDVPEKILFFLFLP